jgi:hypothetical protein
VRHGRCGLRREFRGDSWSKAVAPVAGGSGDSVIDRRAFITSLAFGALLASRSADAQKARGMHRIGWLSPASAADGLPNLEALRAGLRGLGYVEDQNRSQVSEAAKQTTSTIPIVFANVAFPDQSGLVASYPSG